MTAAQRPHEGVLAGPKSYYFATKWVVKTFEVLFPCTGLLHLMWAEFALDFKGIFKGALGPQALTGR